MDDFVTVLAQADEVLLAEVYAAGEAPIAGADGRSLAHALGSAERIEPRFVDDIAAMAQSIMEHARAGDVVLCMGAGSIEEVPAKVVALAQEERQA
jgi:UDP-N-acetylmuramate--alanine ligase